MMMLLYVEKTYLVSIQKSAKSMLAMGSILSSKLFFCLNP
jgi:hypothetical protein